MFGPTDVNMEAERSLGRAIEAHKAGLLVDAEQRYRQFLERRPNDPDALNFLGMLRCQVNDPAEAATLLKRSVEADPSNPHAWLNLGNVLVILRQDEEARAAFTKATELAPDLAMAWFNLGVCLGRCKQPLEAASALHRALKIEPGHLRAYESLGLVLHRLGNYAEAAEVFREWLDHDPANPFARHMLAATSGAGAPSKAADEYVRQLFDDFAANFDENLASLQYRAPQLVAERLGREAAGSAPVDILDAGCGTGLCGPLLAPFARRLVGVDLSTKMLTQAKARSVYDELYKVELTAYLRDFTAAYDVIVSADTLVYFGPLEEVITAAANALRPGGRFVFTVEELTGEASEGFTISPHGRYAHARAYVERVLAGAALDADITTAQLRFEAGAPVPGLVVRAAKPEVQD